jgi:hypothetical protein
VQIKIEESINKMDGDKDHRPRTQLGLFCVHFVETWSSPTSSLENLFEEVMPAE